MKNLKSYILAACITVASVFTLSAQSEPTYWGVYVKDLKGTNLTFSSAGGQAAVTTVTNVAQNLIPAWKYNDCWVTISGKSDGTASGSNLSCVFLPVNRDGTRITGGVDALARGLHVNLILGPSSNAVANTVTAWANIPTTNGFNYTLWMITNAGCNWTNITLKAYGKAPAR